MVVILLDGTDRLTEWILLMSNFRREGRTLMSLEQPVAPDLTSLLVALAISVISATISISQRIIRGHRSSLLWVISEYMSAILCGWLAYDAYPAIQGSLPDWLTRPLLVAAVAHSGGRTFQGIEGVLVKKYGIPLTDRRTDSTQERDR